MLNAFRQKGLTSAVYGVIIVATVVVFVVQFRPGAQGRSGSIKLQCAVEVRGRCIDPKEFFAALMLIAPPRFIEQSQARALGVRRAAADGIAERVLLAQDAERLGLTVSEDDLNDELVSGRAHVSLPVELARPLGMALRLTEDSVRLLPVQDPETKKFDYKIYERVVRQFTNRSATEFKAMQREELLAARMRNLVRSRVRIGDGEALAAYKREKSSATIRYVSLHRDWFAQRFVDTSASAVDAWAKSHEEEVGRVWETRKSQYTPECRDARHILVKVAEEATTEQKAEAKARIESVLKRVRGGEDFAKVAREVSDDTGSAAEGGSLGCFGRGRMVKPFEDTAFGMKAGEISEPIQTQFGFHILKLEGAYSGAEAEAVGRRETAKSLMSAQQAEALTSETGKKILSLVKGGKKLDEALAEAMTGLHAPASANKGKPPVKKGDAAATDPSANDEHRPRVEISASFTANGDPIPGATGPIAAQTAFRLEKEGDTPDDLIKLDDGYAVLQLKEKSFATREQFEKDRDTFVAQLLAGKQIDALTAYVTRLKDSSKADVRVNEAYVKVTDKDKRSEPEDEE